MVRLSDWLWLGFWLGVSGWDLAHPADWSMWISGLGLGMVVQRIAGLKGYPRV